MAKPRLTGSGYVPALRTCSGHSKYRGRIVRLPLGLGGAGNSAAVIAANVPAASEHRVDLREEVVGPDLQSHGAEVRGEDGRIAARPESAPLWRRLPLVVASDRLETA